MQKGRVWDSHPSRACCGEGDQGIYLISPPCPYALIAPQQTSFVGKLPVVCVQGFGSGARLWRLWVVGMVKSCIALTGLTLLATQQGDLLDVAAVPVLIPFPAQTCYFSRVTVSFSAIY